MIQPTYNECVKYILNIPRTSTKHTSPGLPPDNANLPHTLADIRAFLTFMGNPAMESHFIHVAGTNGKGSVCAYLQRILSESGISTGMFTSPHLVTIRERIMIDDRLVSEAEFTSAFLAVKEAAERFSRQRIAPFHPTFFEFIFYMAMQIFALHAPEYIILETGLGGRLDTTNVILAPKVCIITPIGYDHMEYLGDSLTDIAGEKAGILKPGVPAVIWAEREEVTRKLVAAAAEIGCPLFPVKPSDIKIQEIENKTIDFSFHSRYDMYVRLCLSTPAIYQTGNAAMAVRAAELLEDKRISWDCIRDGLVKTYWPGRMEEIGERIFLDGAHNEDGITAFLDTVRTDGCRGKRFLLFGGVRDKQYRRIAHMLIRSGLFAEAAVVPLLNSRSVSVGELAQVFGGCAELAVVVYEDADTGFTALKRKQKDEDVIYITGSLYLAGQIKRGKEKIL